MIKLQYTLRCYYHNVVLAVSCFVKNIFEKYIKNKLRNYAIERKLSKHSMSERNKVVLRWNSRQIYAKEKTDKSIRLKNLEVIVKMSEEHNIPQHVLLSRFDIDNKVLKYRGKDGKYYGNV